MRIQKTALIVAVTLFSGCGGSTSAKFTPTANTPASNSSPAADDSDQGHCSKQFSDDYKTVDQKIKEALQTGSDTDADRASAIEVKTDLSQFQQKYEGVSCKLEATSVVANDYVTESSKILDKIINDPKCTKDFVTAYNGIVKDAKSKNDSKLKDRAQNFEVKYKGVVCQARILGGAVVDQSIDVSVSMQTVISGSALEVAELPDLYFESSSGEF